MHRTIAHLVFVAATGTGFLGSGTAQAQALLVPSSGFWGSASGFATRYAQVVSLSCPETPDCGTITCDTSFSVTMPTGLGAANFEAVLTGFDIRTATGSVESLGVLGVGVEAVAYDPATGDVDVDVWVQASDGDPGTSLFYEADVSLFVITGGPSVVYGGAPTTATCSGTSTCSTTVGGSPSGAGFAATGQVQSYCLESSGPILPHQVGMVTTTDPVTGNVTLDAVLADATPTEAVYSEATVLSGFVGAPQSALAQSGSAISGMIDLPEAPQFANAPWVALEGFKLNYVFNEEATWRVTSGWVAPSLTAGTFDINYGAFLGDIPGNSSMNLDPYDYGIMGRLYRP